MSFFQEPHVPVREVVRMLFDALGSPVDWALWLADNRRYRNAPFLPFRRFNRRVYYKLGDVREFIREKGGRL